MVQEDVTMNTDAKMCLEVSLMMAACHDHAVTLRAEVARHRDGRGWCRWCPDPSEVNQPACRWTCRPVAAPLDES